MYIYSKKMGLFVYISKAGCPTCETYKDINFDKLTKFIVGC